MMEKVSILIPAYNREKYIATAIKSALAQTYKNTEIIIYDDGSTDNTYNIAKEFKNSNIIVFKGEKNKGVGFARNFLLSKATGEYSCWLDSDDLINSERIRKSINKIKESNSDIIYTDIKWLINVNKNGLLLGHLISADISKYNKNNWKSLKNNTVCATAFFKTKLKQYKFVEDLQLGGEDILWLWTLLHNDIKIDYISEVLYYYRKHKNRIGIKKRSKEMEKYKEIENKKIANYIKIISEYENKDKN